MDNTLPPSPPPIPPTPPPPPLPPTPPYIPQRIVPPRRVGRGWKIAVLVLAILLGISLIWNAQHMFEGVMPESFAPRKAGPALEEAVVEYNHSANKIAVVPVEGIIT